MGNWIIALSGVFGAVGVSAGAIGSHVLKMRISAADFDSFSTATNYLLMHAIVLLFVGSILGSARQNVWFKIAGLLLPIGIILFCGSLILRSALGWTALVQLAPLGGSALIFAWLAICTGGLVNLGRQK